MSATASKPVSGPHYSRVRLTDVARSLNLSKGTVSRALNGYNDISESTKLRVRNAAQRMGYSPLSHAQAIKTGKVRSIGLVLQINEHDGHRPFLADFLAGVSQSASEADWTMTMATASSDEDTLRLLQRLTSDRKADGFILPRTYSDDPRVHFLRENNIPFVLYGRTSDPRGCAWYDIESEAAIEEAVGRLVDLGHQRIAYVGGGRGYTYSTLRLNGYKDGLAAAGLKFDTTLVRDHAVNQDEGAAATRALLNLAVPPTAIVFAVDRAAFGAYGVARDLGLGIGRDLSVMSYDGLPEGELVEPPLSTFSVDTKAAGKRLTQLLIRRIQGEDPESLRELARARFLARGSHGRAATPPQAQADRNLTNAKD
ncbi:MAG: substrate-binding domain-containing protein [Pseudomonadota bacterium]